MFIGAIGRRRTFIVTPHDQHIDLPTDFRDMTRATYRKRADGNMRAMLQPVTLSLREAMAEIGAKQEGTSPAGGLSTVDDRALVFAADLVGGFNNGYSGTRLTVADVSVLEQWSGNALGMLVELFGDRASDVYAAWLRPLKESGVLSISHSRNVGAAHVYEYRAGEGLAGRVWSAGISAEHSADRPHPWWVFREGCESSTYICAPVGEPRGVGGVLAVGSDAGFVLTDHDRNVVALFATILGQTAG